MQSYTAENGDQISGIIPMLTDILKQDLEYTRRIKLENIAESSALPKIMQNADPAFIKQIFQYNVRQKHEPGTEVTKAILPHEVIAENHEISLQYNLARNTIDSLKKNSQILANSRKSAIMYSSINFEEEEEVPLIMPANSQNIFNGNIFNENVIAQKNNIWGDNQRYD